MRDTEPDPALTRWAAALDRPAAARGGNARARVVSALRAAIATGALPPGTPIPEQLVADALGTSRNTLREAFRALSHDGLVEHREHRGVCVRILAAEDIVDIYNTRLLIECGALAAAEPTDAQLADLREASDVGVRATATRELDRMRRAGLDFHLGIIALARSPSLDTFAAKLFTQLHLAYHQTTDPAEFHASYFKRNAQICTLLEEGRNTEASNEMRRYLQDAQAHLLSAISTRD